MPWVTREGLRSEQPGETLENLAASSCEGRESKGPGFYRMKHKYDETGFTNRIIRNPDYFILTNTLEKNLELVCMTINPIFPIKNEQQGEVYIRKDTTKLKF